MLGECDKCGQQTLKCGCDRKAFQHLNGEENPQFLIDGKMIYLELRKKYPKNNINDLDNILNGLCAALTCLMYDNVDKADHRSVIQLIYNILNKNA